MGCAPAGPAGTGKTESVKDLSNALAKLVYVLNCSPDMDYKSLGAVWQGVSSSGAWICKSKGKKRRTCMIIAIILHLLLFNLRFRREKHLYRPIIF